MRLVLISMVLAASTLSAQAAVEDEIGEGYACGDLCNAWLTLPRTQPGLRPSPLAHRSRPGRFGTGRLQAHPQASVRDRIRDAVKTSLAVRSKIDGPRQPSPPVEVRSSKPVIASLPAPGVRGGYPGGLPLEQDSRPSQPPIKAAAAPDEKIPAWEQAALRVFQGGDDPTASPLEPTPRPSRRHSRSSH